MMTLIRRILAIFGGGQAPAAVRSVYHADTRPMVNPGFEIIESSRKDALEKWEELKSAGRGVPVIVVDRLSGVLWPFQPDQDRQPVADILAAASKLRIPQDIDLGVGDGYLSVDDAITRLSAEERAELIGQWPEDVPEASPSPLAGDLGNGQYGVEILLIPTDDPTTIPAHLHWGGFNSCPSTAHQVAALRDWREKYGAELVALTPDSLYIRVARKPATREEALELAKAHYAFCLVYEDFGGSSLSDVAADLMVSDWWFFWWD